MPYIGNSPGTGTRNRFIFTATASQTTFSGADDNGKTLAYSDGDYVDVYLNGICLVPVDDYAATSKTSIVLTVGAAASDTLEVVAYDIATIADTVSKANGGTFEDDVSFRESVGIGRTDPTYDLDIKKNIAQDQIVRIGSEGGGGRTIMFADVLGTPTKYNFQVGAQSNVNDAFEITPSTAVGGTTFTNPGIIVTKDSKVGINTTSVSRILEIGSSDADPDLLNLGTSADSGQGLLFSVATSSDKRVRIRNNTSGAYSMAFELAGTEAMRINTSRNLWVGTTSTPNGSTEGIAVQSNGVIVTSHNGSVGGYRYLFGSGVFEQFFAGATNTGSISTNGSTTSFNTTSDYRLKENVTDVTDGITRVKQLAPKRFNFIADPDTTVDGFIAHEAQTVVPEAVTGTQNQTEAVGDITDSDGNIVETGVVEPATLEEGHTWTETGTRPVYQGIDQSKLVPLLTAALQEAIAKIETLETEMTSVKSRLDALEAN